MLTTTLPRTGSPELTPRLFRKQPLRYFDACVQQAQEAHWITPSMLCVMEPEAAKRVLANGDGLIQETSDFFHTRSGPFGPRALQLEIAGGARRLLTRHADRARSTQWALLEQATGSDQVWPNAGNRLLYEYFKPVLATQDRRHALDPLLEEILRHGVFAGARERRSRVVRFFFRRRVMGALEREVEFRVQEEGGRFLDAPRDLFDVLARGTRFGAEARDLGQLYLPFFFAVAGSVGFTLAWALRLLALHGAGDEVSSGAVVREALRLWPIAWQTARRPAVAHEIAGIEVDTDTILLISSYATQRHPAYWADPNRFDPGRWQDLNHPAFFPFGWGPHTCAAASLSLRIGAEFVDLARQTGRLKIESLSSTPFTGSSLAPPRYRLDLH